MKVSELLKILDWDIKVETTLKEETKANFRIVVNYKLPNSAITQNYNIQLQFHSSYSNCGLIYVDLITILMSDWQVYIMSHVNKNKYNSLNSERRNEFKILICKYVLRKCWLEKSFGAKNLLFVHCKHDYQGKVYEFLPVFKGLIHNSYITPKNKNSGNIQIHGVIDISDYSTNDIVSQYLVDTFTDVG